MKLIHIEDKTALFLKGVVARNQIQDTEKDQILLALKEAVGDIDNPLTESALEMVCNALGWQGGTIWQCIDEINRLRAEVCKGPQATNCPMNKE